MYGVDSVFVSSSIVSSISPTPDSPASESVIASDSPASDSADVSAPDSSDSADDSELVLSSVSGSFSSLFIN